MIEVGIFLFDDGIAPDETVAFRVLSFQIQYTVIGEYHLKQQNSHESYSQIQ
jgi:hypothetical protein